MIRFMSEVTRLLQQMGRGDPAVAASLLPLVYDELRGMARARMGQERAGHTLEATALVHEAYLRLMNDGDGALAGFDSRGHFFATAAEAMRRTLIEHARRRQARKNGGGRERVGLDDGGDDVMPAIASPCDGVADLLTLDDAIERLGCELPEAAQLVKLLYFAGLSLDEAAGVMNIGRTTAHRRWTFARAWLAEALGDG
jgi:RNA polymerase sigma factor (TIGR02999 family)